MFAVTKINSYYGQTFNNISEQTCHNGAQIPRLLNLITTPADHSSLILFCIFIALFIISIFITLFFFDDNHDDAVNPSNPVLQKQKLAKRASK